MACLKDLGNSFLLNSSGTLMTKAGSLETQVMRLLLLISYSMECSFMMKLDVFTLLFERLRSIVNLIRL